MAPRTSISALTTLLTLFVAPQISSALQVTPNSPCSSACRDSLDLDTSDPNSSNTRGTDITCLDTAYSSAAGTKFKDCMTCLQTSTFSQGSESDTMWFLYNLRYTAAYCVFGYPNSTGIPSMTPCTTSTACGALGASVKHGVLDPRGTTAYSYCSAGKGEAMDYTQFESCIPCISSEGHTEYLANYFVALEAGCRQQPASGVLLGLDDTIFSVNRISIVDPTTLKQKQDGTPKQGLSTPAIVGIAAGGMVFLLVVAGFTFVCLRKRKNKQKRASAEADFYNKINNRHRSTGSFQCQTHMISPRFWPSAGNEEATPTPMSDAPDAPDAHDRRSSILKPHGPDPYPEQDTTTTTPPHTSPSTAGVGPYYSPSDITYRSPLSADSARSTSALLPAIKPYIPAEHGIHISSPVSATATTPAAAAGTGMTPLLKSHTWSERELYRPHSLHQQPSLPSIYQHETQQQPEQNQHQRDPNKKHITKQTTPGPPGTLPPPPPPPPPSATTPSPAQLPLTLKTSRSNGLLGGGGGRKSPKVVGGGGGLHGSPVETWEIQTAFAGPPRR